MLDLTNKTLNKPKPAPKKEEKKEEEAKTDKDGDAHMSKEPHATPETKEPAGDEDAPMPPTDDLD